jgi:hypothetical protein
MLRDIEQRQPQRRFAKYRKRNSTKYHTRNIAAEIEKVYRSRVRGRYALNAYLFCGLCNTVAAMLSSGLQHMAQAQKQGHLRRYHQSAAYEVSVGKHVGKLVGSLGRKTLYGYAYLMPTRTQYQEALQHIHCLLGQGVPDEAGQTAAERFRMPFGASRGTPLGKMRPQTLCRLEASIAWAEAHAEQWKQLSIAAQNYLRFSPPTFPSIKSDGLSAARRRELERRHITALEAFAGLADDDARGMNALAQDEHERFAQLQQAAYAATRRPVYVPLRWSRADGCSRNREMGLAYDPAKHRYLLLMYVLADKSRHHRTLAVKGRIYDVNDSKVMLRSKRRRSIAILVELECGRTQRALLDQARREAKDWKAHPDSTSGCIRSATLHAKYSTERNMWWFETRIAVGTKPASSVIPEHVVGVHFDPQYGIVITVLSMEGACRKSFLLDDAKVAQLLQNPPTQALLRADQRTASEQHHRLADALLAICVAYRAQPGLEDVRYRHVGQFARQPARSTASVASRTILSLLNYKLPLAGLPLPINIPGVAPRRDCGACGARHEVAATSYDTFTCSACGFSGPRGLNTATEVARRTLWVLASGTHVLLNDKVK